MPRLGAGVVYSHFYLQYIFVILNNCQQKINKRHRFNNNLLINEQTARTNKCRWIFRTYNDNYMSRALTMPRLGAGVLYSNSRDGGIFKVFIQKKIISHIGIGTWLRCY